MALYFLTLTHKLMGGTSLSLSSASNHHHHETFFFFFFFFCVCVCPSFKILPQRQKKKPTMGQKKLKTGLSFETLLQTRDWAKEKMANYGLK
jgi:hypothetical protein